MPNGKKSSEYAPKCKMCEAKTEHFSGMCKDCRVAKCRRCQKSYQAKVKGSQLCHSCKLQLGDRVWHEDEIYSEGWVQ
jgi:hypothetical protein